MELLQLKYFCDAAKTENFSKTAKKYDVPPSNISQSIRRLETELGCALFDRSANRIHLNEAGKCFFDVVSRALALLDRGAKSLHGASREETVSICINTNRRIVMQAVERCRKERPKVSILTRFVVDAEEEDFDLIVSVSDPRLKHYNAQKLAEEDLVLAINKNAPFAVGVSSLADCKDLPFISFGKGADHYRLTTSLCEENGFLPHIAIQSDDPFYIRKCVELGLGLAVVPSLSWRGLFSDEVRLIPLHGKKRNTYLYTKKVVSAAARKMIDLLLEEFRLETERIKS